MNIVSLADESQKAASAAQRDGKRVRNLGKRYGLKAAKAYEDAIAEGLDYARLVAGNNPGRGDAVAKRPDVQFALESAARNAVQAATDQIEAGWAAGSLLGNTMARRQAAALGLPKPKAVLPNEETLAAIRDGMEAVSEELSKSILEALREENPEGIAKAVMRAKLRTDMAGEAAAKYSTQESVQAAMAQFDGLKKKWVPTSPVPCTHCIRLGEFGAILWDEEFPHEFPDAPKLAVYGGKLLGPPRHPRCACILVAVKE